jgi:hypothetical protein
MELSGDCRTSAANRGRKIKSAKVSRSASLVQRDGALEAKINVTRTTAFWMVSCISALVASSSCGSDSSPVPLASGNAGSGETTTTGGQGGEAGSSTQVTAGSGGSSGSASSNTTGGGNAGSDILPGSGGAAGAGGSPITASGGLAFKTTPATITGVRGVSTPPAARAVVLHNGGQVSVDVTSFALSGANQSLFQVTNPPQLPAKVMPGADLPITVSMLASSNALPAAPMQDSGSTTLSVTLTASASSGAVQTAINGLVLTQALWEPTLGQILSSLGYKLNVGLAQNNANPNRGKTVQELPGVEPATDEVAAPLFVKAGSGNVTLTVAARFSPKGPLPFGWYAASTPTKRNTAATMDATADAQTSDKARMLAPPLAPGGDGSFDPGTGSFGIWIYTDQLTQKYDTGTASNGDYNYSQDALNSPANVHRFKAYPLKDAGGVPIANQFLLAVEEAANGDYQDYVLVLGNAKVAP